MRFRKIIALATAIILITNLVLFGFGKVGVVYFWLVIGLCAAIAYYVMPKIK